MILPTMGNILIVMSFFKKYSVRLDLENNIVRFPDITLQLRPTNRTFKTKMMHMQRNRLLYAPYICPLYIYYNSRTMTTKTCSKPAPSRANAAEFKVQIANGCIVTVRKQVLLRIFIRGKIFEADKKHI